MSFSIPVELQLQVLHHLDEYQKAHPSYKDIVDDTLRSCSLVCKAWFLECRRYLMKDVTLNSIVKLENMVSAIRSDRRDVLCLDIMTRLGLSISWDSDGNTPFHHLGIYYLAGKLPSLEILSIDGDADSKDPQLFQTPIPLGLHLRQFHALTSLHIHYYRFSSFWELRRLVVSPPSLSWLTIRKTSWPMLTPRLQRPPSLLSTAHWLLKVSIYSCPVYWDVLWLWATTSRPPSAVEEVTHTTHGILESTCPALVAQDAHVISELIQTFVGEIRSYTIEWQKRITTSSCPWVLQCSNHVSPEAMIKFHIDGRVSKPRVSTRPEWWIGWVRSISYGTDYRKAPPSTEWATKFDIIVSSLEHLSSVHFVFHGDDSFWWDMEGSEGQLSWSQQLREITEWMPQLRNRVNLSFTLKFGSISVTWDQLKEISSLDQLNETIATFSRGQGYTLALNSVDKLILRCLNGTESFHHLALHYLAAKLPFLRTMWINGPATPGGTNQIFPHPKPLPMLIHQFHTLTELKISNYNLQSFWNLRRLVVSPPLLSTLELLNVSWVSPLDLDKCQNLPSLLTTASMLSKVYVESCSFAWDVVWFWTTTASTPFLKSTPNQSSGLRHPILSVNDAYTIVGLLKAMDGSQQSHFGWAYTEDSEGDTWQFTCITSNILEFYMLPSATSLAEIHTLIFIAMERQDLPSGTWVANLNHLVALKSIQFFLYTEHEAFGLDDVRSELTEVLKSIPRIRAVKESSVTFLINGINILWSNGGFSVEEDGNAITTTAERREALRKKFRRRIYRSEITSSPRIHSLAQS